MSNYNRLDEIRQELSQMDYSALPNAELEKLFDAIDSLEEHVRLRNIEDQTPHQLIAGALAEVVKAELNKLTLLITWADDWHNTKKMAEGGM